MILFKFLSFTILAVTLAYNTAIGGSSIPVPMQNWMASLPQQNMGTLYVKIRPPFIPIGFWYKVEAWGQLCDGRDHRDSAHLMLYNKFPFRGKGWTHVAWRCEPDYPDQCKNALSGIVENQKPYSGIVFD